MGNVATSRKKIIIAHICSKCGQSVIQECQLYADGRANAFFHEKDMAEEAREMAFQQAYKDIALCRKLPRQLGSMTEVDTGNKRMWAFYKVENLDIPCKCGHMEPWQQGKKSKWNPVDGPFELRENYPSVPVESRPVLLDSQEAVDAWFADPKAAPVSGTAGTAEPAVVAAEEKRWTCAKCGTSNRERIQTCQGCGVSKSWSDAKNAKKK